MTLDLAHYVYVTDRIYSFTLPQSFAAQITTLQTLVGSEDGKDLLTLDPAGTIICHPGIYTDGASPKFRFGKLIIGTWDGLAIDSVPQCLGAFTKHDILGKFAGQHPFGYMARHQLMLWAILGTIPPAIQWLNDQPFSWRCLYRWPLVFIWYFLGPVYFLGVVVGNPIYNLIIKARQTGLPTANP